MKTLISLTKNKDYSGKIAGNKLYHSSGYLEIGSVSTSGYMTISGTTLYKIND